MAARLSLAGATADGDWNSFAPDEFEVVRISVEDDKQLVRRAEIPALLTSRTFFSAWREWSRYRRFGGLANGGGWRRERPSYVRALEVLEQEFEDYQSEEMEKHCGRR